MPETATSSFFVLPPSSAHSSTTPTSRPPHRRGSVGQVMTPHFSSARSIAAPLVQPPSVGAPNGASPSYFGFTGGASDPPKHPWGTPSSAVRSTAAPSPCVYPLDQNPDFALFRRQSETKAFTLNAIGQDLSTSGPRRNSSKGSLHQGAKGEKRSSGGRDIASTDAARSQPASLEPPGNELSRSPKRLPSPGSVILPEETRRASPASFASRSTHSREYDPSLESKPRFALPLDGTLPTPALTHADSLPAKEDPDQQFLVSPQHVVNLVESDMDNVLLLDLRVATQFAKSHLSGALNLCIPTTLLKRPSFNVQKLAETFRDEGQRRKFESWNSCQYIIVYDAAATLLKDATTCLNTIKKFRSEGFQGRSYIIKGGFSEFLRRFPSLVDQNANSSRSNSTTTGVDSDGPEVAPVAGGCPMPSTAQPANPFFGNIRQNMDLIGGVGQIPLQHPLKATDSVEREDFPAWLRRAADRKDEGKAVSHMFERIERSEKKRMEDALSGGVSWSTPDARETNKSVQIAGLEKGNKNRYNNIWPFEHSRVKLQGVSNHGCDYINANHVYTSWSNKRYITTQAPIPATFNDFWNMIWQQDIRVVVMLTAEREGGQVKADNYWSKGQYGPLRLELLSEQRASVEPERIRRHHYAKRRSATMRRSSTSTTAATLIAPLDNNNSNNNNNSAEKVAKNDLPPHIVVRRFTLSHERSPFEPMREIVQLHYSAWPDFGAPANPKNLLGLVEQADAVARAADRASYRASDPVPENARPLLVHCSAGCGRTGAFCTVDSVVDMLKRQRAARSTTTPRSQQRRQQPRQTTPMDVDQTAQSKNGSHLPTGHDRPDSSAVNGEWVQRDDTDLIARAVEDFRSQRISMVQSLRQFVLCYEAIMEWFVEERLDALGREDAAVDGTAS